ncbi:MAG: cell envelope integrity protein TolA [Succinivibrio sp.]
MKINMKVAFIIAVALHAVIIAFLVIRVSLDKPSRPNMGQGDIMHATFIPPAKGNPNGKAQNKKSAESVKVEDTKKKLEEIERKREENQKQLEQKKAEQEKKRLLAEEQAKKVEQEKELALKKKKAEEKKKLEEEKKKKLEEEKKKLEEEKKKKLEEEKKKLEEEKKKLEEEKKKLEEQKKLEEKKKKEAEAKKKAEEEAKKKAEAEAKAKAAAEARAKAAADSLEDDILGTADGDEVNGQGLGSAGGGDGGYGDKVRGLIEQNWRIDQSMNGKKVVVSIRLSSDGTVMDKTCQGDTRVCDSAIKAIDMVGLFPKPPATCPECSNIKISMTPKL